ncbi:isoprenylcysteine carboxylmethyltransferase family protein [Nocardiopsis sp. NPDC006139]|uniref:methyltransferase family protein n=1 Tax=Nocardiopsis sp. NPDC006139 TaxID=3154578 RepID=UPI0033AA244D
MAITALALYAVFIILTATKTQLQRRHGTDTGIRRPATPLGWIARLPLALGSLSTGVAAPIAELVGLTPLPGLDQPALRAAGAALAALGVAGTFATQLAMGLAWRTTPDETERPPLVTAGPFRLVRNPIYTAYTAMSLGLALTVPNPIAAFGAAAVLIGVHMQVRAIEEPYLQRIHGAAYLDYSARTGRFLPGIGRLSDHGTTKGTR